MTAAELQRLLRDRRFPPLLLLYGEESYLIDGVLRQLRDRVVAPEARDFNLEIFSARDCRAAAGGWPTNCIPGSWMRSDARSCTHDRR